MYHVSSILPTPAALSWVPKGADALNPIVNPHPKPFLGPAMQAEPMDTDMGEDTRREQPASAPKDTSAPASTHGPHFSPDPSWEAILDKGWVECCERVRC